MNKRESLKERYSKFKSAVEENVEKMEEFDKEIIEDIKETAQYGHKSNIRLINNLEEFAKEKMPVKHIVMFRLKEEATAADHQAIQEALLRLPDTCGVKVLSYECGADLKLPAGQAHPLGPNRHIVWSLTTENVKDYDTYNTSEAHKQFLALLKPLLEPGSRAAIQYEIP